MAQKIFSIPLNPKLAENQFKLFYDFLKDYKDWIYDIYFTCRIPPFTQDAMGEVFTHPMGPTDAIWNAINLQKDLDIPISATFNNTLIRPTQQNLDLWIKNFAPLYEHGVKNVTIPHTHWMMTGQITSRELTEIYLERIERYGELLQCFVTVTPALARGQADQADQERKVGNVRGPLHGVPYGVKDLLDTKEISTTWGAEPYKNRVSTQNAFVVNKLEDAGAVLIAKLAVGALAYGDIWFGGTCKNPFDLEEGSF